MENTINDNIEIASIAGINAIVITDDASAAKAMKSFFGPVVFAYTRAMALADGVLVDVTTMARRYGFRCPVAITEAIYNKLGEGRSDAAQEFLIKSLLFKTHRAIVGSRTDEDRVFFDWSVNQETIKLWVRIHGGDNGTTSCAGGEMVFTIMLQGED